MSDRTLVLHFDFHSSSAYSSDYATRRASTCSLLGLLGLLLLLLLLLVLRTLLAHTNVLGIGPGNAHGGVGGLGLRVDLLGLAAGAGLRNRLHVTSKLLSLAELLSLAVTSLGLLHAPGKTTRLALYVFNRWTLA